MALQGASNKLSVIMVSESCLFPLCVKLEARSHSHLQLREMSLYFKDAFTHPCDCCWGLEKQRSDPQLRRQ